MSKMLLFTSSGFGSSWSGKEWGKVIFPGGGENTLEFSVQIVRIPPPLPPPSPPYVSALDIMFNKKIPSVIEGSAERGGGMLDISLPPL